MNKTTKIGFQHLDDAHRMQVRTRENNVCVLADLLPSSDTENPSQRPSPSTGQTPPGSHLGTGWMQGAYFRPSETPRTWPTVHPSLQPDVGLRG